jgi:hypothetical protein
MPYNERGYWLVDIPPLSSEGLASFDNLPLDVYTSGKQRYRRFTAYRMYFEKSAWRLEALPPRPFLQPSSYNTLTGGVPRVFEPMQLDPTPQMAAIAKTIGLDGREEYALNVHQVRVIANSSIKGIVVPEGPHRDGHYIIMTLVFARKNIRGGASQLMDTGSNIPFFDRVLSPGQGLIVEDERMWHYATDIEALDGSGGYRDIWIVSLNLWKERRYGEEYEARVSAVPVPEKEEVALK